MRRLGKGDVIGGFAGATADAFTLFERLEAKLEQYPGQLMRAAVELAKDWRTDRYLRRLEAMMIVADKEVSLVLTGTGDVLEPEAGVVGIGSGGNYALAAARALLDGPLDAEAIVRKSLDIAADICVYTNRNVTVETLKSADRIARPAADFAPMPPAMLAVQATVLLAMGRVADLHLRHRQALVGRGAERENSQLVSDWYSFTHVIHGFMFYRPDWLALPLAYRGSATARARPGMAAWEHPGEHAFVIDQLIGAGTISLDTTATARSIRSDALA